MSEQVEASALDRAVEAGCRAIARHAEDVSGSVINDSWLSAVIEPQLRIAVQAADDHLREHYWAEFRERLEGEETITIELTRESGQALLDGVEFSLGYGVSGDLASEAADAIHAALATTQHKGGSQ